MVKYMGFNVLELVLDVIGGVEKGSKRGILSEVEDLNRSFCLL